MIDGTPESNLAETITERVQEQAATQNESDLAALVAYLKEKIDGFDSRISSLDGRYGELEYLNGAVRDLGERLDKLEAIETQEHATGEIQPTEAPAETTPTETPSEVKTVIEAPEEKPKKKHAGILW